MSRRDRRLAKKNIKKFEPKKSRTLDRRVIVFLALVGLIFFIGSTLIKYSA